jgi:ArsR family transcriptional regulator, arsenate/arsenite/antimonite-responsive transcriptional repressor
MPDFGRDFYWSDKCVSMAVTDMLALEFCSNCLKVLSDPTRAAVIKLLAEHSPRTVTDLVASFKLRQPTISHHLQLLKESRFVLSEKKGNKVYYSLNPHCHPDGMSTCIFFQQIASHSS